MIAASNRTQARFSLAALLVFISGLWLTGCQSGGTSPDNEMLRSGIPAGMGLVYGRIYPYKYRLFLLNWTTQKKHSITTEVDGRFFILLPAGDYAIEEYASGRYRTRERNLELAKQFTVPAGSPVYVGSLQIFERKEILLSDEYEAATADLKYRYPELRLAKPPAKSLMQSPISQALALVKAGRYSEATRVAEKTLSLSEKNHGPAHRVVAISLYTLARVYQAQGRYDDAEPLYKRARAAYEKTRGPNHRDVATILVALGSLYWKQGKFKEAEPYLEKALAIYDKIRAPDHSTIEIAMRALVKIYDHLGKRKKADALHQRADAMEKRLTGKK